MPQPLIPASIRDRVRDLVPQLTLEEKASLLVGKDFWTSQEIERLGISSIWMTDGPTGVRKAPTSDAVGIGDSEPSTCFPTASLLGATWDMKLVERVGAAIGREARGKGVHILLGPGVNLKRSPLAGRNFEYIAEDPVLSGTMAAAYINGVQSQGVGTSIKHFVANEQETDRMTADSLVDERTLREVYLRPFEIAIDEANPWTVMCAYNRLNGTHCAENESLLHGILKDDWGYEGIVLSDWTAVNERVDGVRAGLHVQMPGAPTAPQIVAAVHAGNLSIERVDEMVGEVLAIVLLAEESAQPVTEPYDAATHHALARAVAAAGMVLLKNQGGLLPIDPAKSGKIALVGEFARTPRFQGAGSSRVNPTRVDTLLDQLAAALPGADIGFAPGYVLEGEAPSNLIGEAARLAADAQLAVVVVGLTEEMESEGLDRAHLNLPASHNELVRAVLDAQPNTVVVVVNGAAIAMPWAHEVPTILEAWLGGQAAGGAIADVLTGVVNPSGKLSETFPRRIEDTPSYLHFPTDGDGTVRFAEGVFHGHRWYDARKIEPLFPFGHGLSYTTFAYEGLTLDTSHFHMDDTIDLTVSVENTGDRSGGDVVQVYVAECAPVVPRPVRELRAFAKVDLEPGDEITLHFSLHWQDFAYWDAVSGQWSMRSGEYEISIGSSSRDIRLSARKHLQSLHEAPVRVDEWTTLKAALSIPAAAAILTPLTAQLPPMLLLFMHAAPLRKLAAMGMIPPESFQQLLNLETEPS